MKKTDLLQFTSGISIPSCVASSSVIQEAAASVYSVAPDVHAEPVVADNRQDKTPLRYYVLLQGKACLGVG